MSFISHLVAFALGIGTAYVASETVKELNQNLQLHQQLLKEIRADKNEFAKCINAEIKKKYFNGTLMNEIFSENGYIPPLPSLSSNEFFEHEDRYLKQKRSIEYLLSN